MSVLVQNAQRRAPTGILLKHSGHSRVWTGSFDLIRAMSIPIGRTIA